MRLVNESEMIEILGCTRAQFQGYIEANVFAPCIKPVGKRKNKGAVYDAGNVEAEVAAFQKGEFTPTSVLPKSESGEVDKPASATSNDADGIDSGKVIRFNYDKDKKGKIEEREISDFDYEKVVGDISTFKKLRLKLLEITPNPKVPYRVKKDLRETFDLMARQRERIESRKKKIPIEKYESDCQKVFDAAMSAWSGEAGIAASEAIVTQIEAATGKPIRREISNVIQIVHRCIVDSSNKIVQPSVLKVLSKL